MSEKRAPDGSEIDAKKVKNDDWAKEVSIQMMSYKYQDYFLCLYEL